ncbi:MAG: transporter substrate-binding domain-containing protein [Treponema sp.]|nr:transporter substrate-binding domain-containing protein [Treponema sp.]
MKKFTKNLFKKLVSLTMTISAFAFLSCKKEKTDVQTIIVGTGSDMQLYCYLDEKGELAGYEIDVMKAIDELLPQYKFEFQTFDFKNILLALSAGKVDIGAHAYESNPERRKNYLFTDYGYNDFSKYIVVLKENTEVKSLKDLVGKTAQASTGSATGAILQHWNEDHPDAQINAVLTSALTNEQVVAAMKNGTYDAFFTNIPSFNQIQKEYGEIFRLVEEPISNSAAYFIFNLENPTLKADVDVALKKLIDSGELAKLAIKDLGSDTTKNINK